MIQPTSASRPVASIEALRGVAALLIVLFHCRSLLRIGDLGAVQWTMTRAIFAAGIQPAGTRPGAMSVFLRIDKSRPEAAWNLRTRRD
jgi:hypothetical protein